MVLLTSRVNVCRRKTGEEEKRDNNVELSFFVIYKKFNHINDTMNNANDLLLLLAT